MILRTQNSCVHTIKRSPVPILDDAVGFILELFDSRWFGLSFANFAVVSILDDTVRIPELLVLPQFSSEPWFEPELFRT